MSFENEPLVEEQLWGDVERSEVSREGEGNGNRSL